MENPDTSPRRTDPEAPPPAPARRPAWEVALLFAAITLFLFLWWRAQHPTRPADSVAVTFAMRAERYAQTALATAPRPGQPRHSGPMWAQARTQYRRALETDPRLPRARRGLAAMEYLEGDNREARRLMSAPVDVSADDRDIWTAFQTAFGARPEKGDPDRRRATLQRRDLGWSRFVALKALADDPAEAARWEAALHRKGSFTPFSGGVALLIGTLGLAGVLAGLSILGRYLSSPPPNRMAPMNAPPGSLLVLAMLSLLLSQLPALFLRMAAVSGGGAEPSGEPLIRLTALGTLAGVLLMLPVAHIMLRSVGSGLGEVGWHTRGLAKWSVGGYLAMLPLLLTAVILSNVLNNLFPNVPTPDNPAAGLAASATGPGIVLVLLFAAVLVPIIEEFVMRGLLFRGLAARYGTTLGAVASSFLFAGLHPQLPAGFPPLFVIGLGLCLVYRASGSLVPAIVIHGASNGLILLMEWLAFS